MDQANEVTPGDEQSEQLAAYIARYLKRGVAVDTIRKGLEHNDWSDQDFEQAVSAAKTIIEAEEAKAKAAKEAEEESKRAKRAKRRKRSERKEPTERKKERRGADDDADAKEVESSAGAASFSQDEAVLLHEPPKPKTDHFASTHEDEDLEAPVGPADLTADTEIPLSRTITSHAADTANDKAADFDADELLRQLTGQPGEEPTLSGITQPPYPAAGSQPANPYAMPWQQPLPGPYPYSYPYPPAPGWQPGATAQAGGAVPMQGNPYPPNQGPYPTGPYGYPYPMPGQATWPPQGNMAAPGGYPYPAAPYGYAGQNPYGNIPAQDWVQPAYGPYPASPAAPVVVSGTGFPAVPTGMRGPQPAANRRTAGVSPNAHYSLAQALKDGYQAAANNIVNYLLAIVLSGIAASALFILALVVIHKLFTLKYNLLLIAPRKIFIAAFGSLTVYALFYILAGTLVITLTSLALSDGGLKRKRPINTLMRRSVALSGRVGSALIVSGSIIFLPAALIVIVPVLILTSTHALALMAQLLPFLYGAAFIWVLMAGMRYALTPYVALFGRDTRLSGMLSRSHALLGGSAQWLVAQITLAITVIALGISLATGHGWRQAISADNPALIIAISVLLLIASGALVMLYRNQKLIRGRS